MPSDSSLARAELYFSVEAEGPDGARRYSDSFTSATRVGGHSFYYDSGNGGAQGTPWPQASGVYTGLANPCPVGVCVHPEAKAYGDIDGATGRLRAFVSVNAAKSGNYDAFAGGELVDLIDPGISHVAGTLMPFHLDLESHHSAVDNPDNFSFGTTRFDYGLTLSLPQSPPGCGFGEPYVSCDTTFASFVFNASRDGSSGTSWSWSLTYNQDATPAQTGSGAGEQAVIVNFSIVKPFQPFVLTAGGSAFVSCGTDAAFAADCRASVDATNSAYLSIGGDYSSASGFQYLNRAQVAAIPEPASSAMWLVGLVAVGRLVRRRIRASSAAAPNCRPNASPFVGAAAQ